MRKIIFPLILGVGGIAVLMYLGFWQVQRLAWKEGILADIDARMSAAPMVIPAAPDEDDDEYRAVTVVGALDTQELHVLVSGTAAGTGYRVIKAMEVEDGRRILVDIGLLPLEAKEIEVINTEVAITGNLIWPDDVNASTPEPDLAANIWFGRDVVAMADTLNTDPIMVVARQMSPADPRVTPLPVDTSTIKNDHLEYAITWFLLAFVWAIMTLYLIYRTTRQKDA